MSLILLLSPLTQAPVGTIVGTASISLGEATVLADGIGTALGTASIALGTATVVAAGNVTSTVIGTASIALGTATVVAAGNVTSTVIGTASVTLSPATVVGAGNVITVAVGTASVTLSPATISSSGAVLPFITGALSQTLSSAAINATGFQTAVGTLTATLNPATVNASGFQTAVGTLTSTLDPTTVNAAGFQTARGVLNSTLGSATLVGVGVPTPATATLLTTLGPVQFVSLGTLTTSPAAPTFGPIATSTAFKILKALATYELVGFSSANYVLVKATGITIPPISSNTYTKSLLESAQSLDAMVTTFAKLINDTVSTTDSLTTGDAPKIDSVAVSTVGYGLLQDYVSGDYFAEDYTGSSFTF